LSESFNDQSLTQKLNISKSLFFSDFEFFIVGSLQINCSSLLVNQSLSQSSSGHFFVKQVIQGIYFDSKESAK
jgi:hypothetical protein